MALLGIMLLLFQALQGRELVILAEKAGSAYVNGDYATAMAQYEALIESGIEDHAIYLNLGNTYFQLQDLGRALLNYRRAQRFAPRDSMLNSYLARVRSTRVDVQGDESSFVDSLAALTLASLTDAELQTLVLGMWCLFFISVIVVIVRSRWRDALRGWLIVSGIVLFLGLTLWGSRVYSGQFRPPAVVLESTVQVLSGPGSDYLPLYELHAAAELRILESRGDWVRFILPDQQQGWIQREAVELI